MEKMKKLSEDWQINKQCIRERAKYLLENPVWSDCKFLVGIEEPYLRVSTFQHSTNLLI